jgi:hemerythrin superfamily protein
MKNPETIEQKTALLNEWIRRIGLEKWTIYSTLDEIPSQMDNKDHAGEAEWHATEKIGYIRVLAKRYHELDDKYDFERTLVHELLHLKFAVFWDNSEGFATSLLHQTIEKMASALVDAKRSGESIITESSAP